jgi:hypothetical protein
MSIARHHAEWLSLVESSGPFLALPVLKQVFPQGLPKVEVSKGQRLRAAYEEWADATSVTGPDNARIHESWINSVLREFLGFDDATLRSGDKLPEGLVVRAAEHGEMLVPSTAVVEPAGGPSAGQARLLICTMSRDQALNAPMKGGRWAASPLERMTLLCRGTGVRFGLVTNGEQWAFVDASEGQLAGYAHWYSRLWLQESLTLAAFEALLGVRRFFSTSETETLEAMLTASVSYQAEVTDQLGYQVRRAVEVLVQAIDRADVDRGRKLLADVPPDRLYEAALTVMMRLVFLLCAEERGLLLLGDEAYEASYAASTLRGQLREEADRVGLEVLERRQDAWARLLATFRVVFGGIEHEALRLPALGGSLFDPDRFPFLEGRSVGSSWVDVPASPLPIDNRTVLHLLEALQLLRLKGDDGTSEARRLSFRALDIEQIGHVYEGLLDHKAVRVTSDTIGLSGAKNKQPELSLDDLQREKAKGVDALVAYLKEQTGRSVSALRRAVGEQVDEASDQKLLVACSNDAQLRNRVRPYHALLRSDVWGYPQVYRAGSFMVTGGEERRQTGTHYTPKSITEKIVAETLEPLAYDGPAAGKPKEQWKLRTSAELLDLKVCDLAMGSGAFLVEVCRWLSERVLEAWEQAERDGMAISVDGEVINCSSPTDRLGKDREERIALARRLIAERCLYGIDLNPLAVELAKLSLWLVTLAKGRPFGFLDHNLRAGDSLLGIADINQIECFHLEPDRGSALHRGLFDPTEQIREAIATALEARVRLRAVRILDIEDVIAKARLDAKAKAALVWPDLLCDLLVGIGLTQSSDAAFDNAAVDAGGRVLGWLQQGDSGVEPASQYVRSLLDEDCPERLQPRRPLHFTVEFPEVFARERPGFDAIVGNPPYMGGQKLTGALGKSAREFFVKWLARGARGSADLSAYFVLRAYDVVRDGGCFGLIVVNSIAEGDTRQVGLEALLARGAQIYAAYPNEPWPGAAAVVTSRVHVRRGPWSGSKSLLGRTVQHISAFLSDRDEGSPIRLKSNEGFAFQGSIVLGMGFVVSEESARNMIELDPRNRDVLFPYLNGEDLNSDPEQKPSRWVINFWDLPEEEAKTYVAPFAIVSEKVRPERLANKYSKSAREKWWLFERARPELYRQIGRGGRFQLNAETNNRSATCPEVDTVLVASRVSKHLIHQFVPASYVYDVALNVFSPAVALRSPVLNSSIYEIWVRINASKLKNDTRYTLAECFETFPFPSDGDRLQEMGRSFLEARTTSLRMAGVGLTRLYNLLHTPDAQQNHMVELRHRLIGLDREVALAYGWGDIDLAHDFFAVPHLPENDRVRFTISETARSQVLKRLGELNRERSRIEVGAVL